MIRVSAEVGKNIKNAMGSKKGWIKHSFLIASSSLFYALSFPPFNISYFAWFALVPLLIIQHSSFRKSLLNGYMVGLFSNLIIFFWFWGTFKAAGMNPLLTLSCWVALCAVLALYFAVFKLCADKIKPSLVRPFLLAAIWVGLEIVRSHALTGFPWALLAHTQAYHPSLIQISAITGALGVSFLIVLINGAVESLIQRHHKWGWIGPALCLCLCLGYGLKRLNTNDIHGRPLKVALLQGNIDQYQKWDEQYEYLIREVYADLAQKAAVEKPDIIVWPESAIPAWYPNESFYLVWVSTLVKQTDTYHLIGAVTSENGNEFNSAFVLSPDGVINDHYNKRHLVPFGEYIPFGNFLKKWIVYLGQLGVFDAGQKEAVLNINSYKCALSICYEAIFPELIRHSAQQSDVIVNITNDGWFLDTAAPEQHYVTNIFRAIENDRPVIRAANTGISALIDSRGREILRTPLMKRDVFIGTIYIGKK